MEFPTQFNPFKQDSEKKRLRAVMYSEPVEGFVPGQCESLSKLVQRLTVGQSVPYFSGGVYAQDQIFDTEMVDQFDLMDTQNELMKEIGKESSRKAAEESEDDGQVPPGTPPPE